MNKLITSMSLAGLLGLGSMSAMSTETIESASSGIGIYDETFKVTTDSIVRNMIADGTFTESYFISHLMKQGATLINYQTTGSVVMATYTFPGPLGSKQKYAIVSSLNGKVFSVTMLHLDIY